MKLIALSKSRVLELGIPEKKLIKYIEGHSRHNTDLFERIYSRNIGDIDGLVLYKLVKYNYNTKEEESYMLYSLSEKNVFEPITFPETYKDFNLLTTFSGDKELFIQTISKDGTILFRLEKD